MKEECAQAEASELYKMLTQGAVAKTFSLFRSQHKKGKWKYVYTSSEENEIIFSPLQKPYFQFTILTSEEKVIDDINLVKSVLLERFPKTKNNNNPYSFNPFSVFLELLKQVLKGVRNPMQKERRGKTQKSQFVLEQKVVAVAEKPFVVPNDAKFTAAASEKREHSS